MDDSLSNKMVSERSQTQNPKLKTQNYHYGR